jgi:hypothetical protein
MNYVMLGLNYNSSEYMATTYQHNLNYLTKIIYIYIRTKYNWCGCKQLEDSQNHIK